MKYMMFLHSDPSFFRAMTPDQRSQSIGAYTAYTAALKTAHVFAGGDQLTPSASASTVRVLDGKTIIKDGPFAETKEQIGGYYIIEAPDLDAALKWAAKCPGAQHGTIEVRAISEM